MKKRTVITLSIVAGAVLLGGTAAVAGPIVYRDLIVGPAESAPSVTAAPPADTGAASEAADLTGPSGGHPLEIDLRELLNVAFAPTRDAAGRAIHARAVLVAPSRPGRALADAAARGLPVAS